MSDTPPPEPTPPSPIGALVDLEDGQEISPAMLVEHATTGTAQDIADLLVELLADDDTPEDVARDMEARLRSLYHRFPGLTDDGDAPS